MCFELCCHQPPRFAVGVGGSFYHHYRMLTLAEFQSSEARALLHFHHVHGGFPLLPPQLKCNFTLFVAEGRVKVGGAWIVQAGYSDTKSVLNQADAYVCFKYNSTFGGKEPWTELTPTEAELTHATVFSFSSPDGYPCLFVHDLSVVRMNATLRQCYVHHPHALIMTCWCCPVG